MSRTGATGRTARTCGKQKAYRDAYGHFFYRFAQGESGADVYDRAGAFLESLWRSFERPDHPPNVLIVTHGLTMRLFCMRWLHWSVAEFESLSNPGNAETRTLELRQDGRYHLDRPFEHWCTPRPYGPGHLKSPQRVRRAQRAQHDERRTPRPRIQRAVGRAGPSPAGQRDAGLPTLLDLPHCPVSASAAGRSAPRPDAHCPGHTAGRLALR